MTDEQAQRAADVLSVIANPSRIRMIHVLAEGEVNVGDLATKVGLSQSATSQHLHLFKEAGILHQRKHRQARYCRIKAPVLDILVQLIRIAENQEARPVKRNWYPLSRPST